MLWSGRQTDQTTADPQRRLRGQARGAAICAAVSSDLPVSEYAPREVKQAVVGKGGADKRQVQHMVCVLLRLAGMDWYESICHAFTTLATGGFSTRNASVGAFNSAFVDYVIITFMFLGGVTFMLFYHAALGRWRMIWGNTEFRWYLGFLVFFCGGVTGRG